MLNTAMSVKVSQKRSVLQVLVPIGRGLGDSMRISIDSYFVDCGAEFDPASNKVHLNKTSGFECCDSRLGLTEIESLVSGHNLFLKGSHHNN